MLKNIVYANFKCNQNTTTVYWFSLFCQEDMKFIEEKSSMHTVTQSNCMIAPSFSTNFIQL